MVTTERRSACLLCIHNCAIVATVEEDRVIAVRGDREDPLYGGYLCVKGRALPEFVSHPERLLRPLIRTADGRLTTASYQDVIADIATRLRGIIDRHGPRSVACYLGTQLVAATGVGSFASALMNAIGSPMRFTPNTIDKPGKDIARALHGTWLAPQVGFDDPNVILLIGANPLVTYTGFPHGNPGKWLSRKIRSGTKLIVIDPRASDVARRAHIHLQPRPGTDGAILAGMIRIVLEEGLTDDRFIVDNVDGRQALEQAVAPFTASAVAELADIQASALEDAARMWAKSKRGYAMAGTGASMSGPGTLISYLVLVLETICGYWMREGERVRNPGTLCPTRGAKAQAAPPVAPAGSGERLRVRGLTNTPAGLPTSALSDEILLAGDGQVKALISVGGNPAVAFPGQHKTVEALQTLELLVQVDPWMSETAKIATHVLPTKLCLEIASTNWVQDQSSAMAGYGTNEPYARYVAPAVPPPPGSDLMEEWEIVRELARHMDITLNLTPAVMWTDDLDERNLALPPEANLTSEDVLDFLSQHSRVPLAEVRKMPGGFIYSDHDVRVEPKDPGWAGRLDVGNPEMLDQLALVLAGKRPGQAVFTGDNDLPFRLLCRRLPHVYNSSFNDLATNHGRPFNPAFMHSLDLSELGLVSGDAVTLSNSVGSIRAIVIEDDSLRRGVVSMAFGFGVHRDNDDGYRIYGSSTALLVRNDVNFDRYTGQPLMSNIPIRVTPL